MPKIIFFILLLYFYLLNSAFGYDAEIKKFLDQFDSSNRIAVSYTHLTLPTIRSV